MRYGKAAAFNAAKKIATAMGRTFMEYEQYTKKRGKLTEIYLKPRKGTVLIKKAFRGYEIVIATSGSTYSHPFYPKTFSAAEIVHLAFNLRQIAHYTAKRKMRPLKRAKRLTVKEW